MHTQYTDLEVQPLSILNAQLQNQLQNQLHFIASDLEKLSQPMPTGLLSGTAGIVVFYAQLAKIFPQKYLDICFQYIEKLVNEIAEIPLASNLSSGLAGCAFALNHAVQLGILDCSEELNLDELDAYLIGCLEVEFENKHWDPLHGFIGIGIYFLERHKSVDHYLILQKIILKLNLLPDLNAWITPAYREKDEDNYNFGMAHGIPGIISFLAKCHNLGIEKERCSSLINKGIKYLLENKNNIDFICDFPSQITVKDATNKSKKEYSRLAWCYGDLCVSNALIHCGKALNNIQWITEGITIAKKAALREIEQVGIVEAGFCHGAAGILHQFNRMYQFSKDPIFLSTVNEYCEFILNNYANKNFGIGGYTFFDFDIETEERTAANIPGLLEGSAGVGLVYLSLLYNTGINWDTVFLTDI